MGKNSGSRAMRPTLAVSPLSPERACANHRSWMVVVPGFRRVAGFLAILKLTVNKREEGTGNGEEELRASQRVATNSSRSNRHPELRPPVPCSPFTVHALRI